MPTASSNLSESLRKSQPTPKSELTTSQQSDDRQPLRANPGKSVKRKLVEWTIFAIVAAGTVLFVRWFVPWAIVRYYRPSTQQARLYVRRRLQEAERKLAAKHTAVPPGTSGVSPCLVVAVPAGVGSHPAGRARSPIRDCLALVPGGPPADFVEMNLRTDDLIFVQTDMYLPGDPPIAFTRVVEPFVKWNQRFQVFLQNEYDSFPFGSRFPFTYMKIELADRREVFFQRISKGTGYVHAVYEHTVTVSPFYHALDGWNGNGWDVDMPDGRTLVFPPSYYARRPQQGALTGLIEPSGASLTLKRDREGNLQSVNSSNGGWMKLGYKGPLIVSLDDSAGQKASFSYGSGNLLTSSTNAEGETLSYSYNQQGGLTAVRDVTTHTSVVKASYDRRGLLTSLQVGGGTPFEFAYYADPRGRYSAVVLRRGLAGRWIVLMWGWNGNGCQYRIRGLSGRGAAAKQAVWRPRGPGAIAQSDGADLF